MWCLTAQQSLLVSIALPLFWIGVVTNTNTSVINGPNATIFHPMVTTSETRTSNQTDGDSDASNGTASTAIIERRLDLLDQNNTVYYDETRQNVNKQIINYNKSFSDGFDGELILMIEFREMNLTCNLTDVDSDVVWLKDGSEIDVRVNDTEWHQILSLNDTVNGAQSIFHIIRINESDVGDYQCRSVQRPDEVLASYILRPKPRVMWNLTTFTGSHTKYVDNDWEVSCNFMSHEYERDAVLFLVRCPNQYQLPNDYNNVNISCQHYNLDELVRLTHIWVSQSHNRIKLSRSVNLVENGTYKQHSVGLSIKKVNYQDINMYYCVGINPVFYNNMSMVLRVKDRVDSVWPVITLTCLAMYLFSLVGIYESRRVRATSLHKLELEQSI